MTQKRNIVLFILLCFLLNRGYSQTDEYHFKAITENKGNAGLQKYRHYYVDGSVSESGDGSKHSPFQTIQEAAEIMKAGDVCCISGGIYRETIRPVHSGTPEAPLVFQPEGTEKVVISGCERVDGWQYSGDCIYKTKIELDLADKNQVFADGHMMVEARWPNAGGTDQKYLLEFRMATMDEGTTTTKIVDDALPDIDWSGTKAWVSSNRRWFCWTGKIEGSGSGYIQVENNADDIGNQKCQKGGKYYLFGSESLLDTLNEYHYDRTTGFLRVLMPDGGSPQGRVEVKKRPYAFDLRGVSNVVLKDLNIFGASIITDEDSRNITMDRLEAKYVYHSSRAVNQYSSQTGTGIILKGRDHTLTNSVIAYSSGNCLTLSGSNIHIINNYIHDANYIGSYASPVQFARGCRNCIVSHNTITRAGRSIIEVSGFYASLLQYNDLSYAGYLTDDLGLTYGNGVEGGNSEVRYNWLHHNMADSHNMGLYFDHGCKNLIFHHNVIWGVEGTGMINNQYGNYLLYYNNTISDARYSYRSTWAAGQKKDLYGCQLFNNIGTSVPAFEASGLEMNYNSWNYNKLHNKKFPVAGSEPVNSGMMIPGITDEYTGSKPDRGAYEIGLEPWVPGHNFDDPPAIIDTARSQPPHRNLIKNAAFFSGDIKPWETQGADVEITQYFHGQWESTAKTMMGGYSIKLGKGRNSLRQRVEGLKPGKTYEFMAKFRVPEGEEARLVVKEHGGPVRYGEIVSGNEPEWKMETLRFTTGMNNTTAIIVLEKISAGEGMVYVDDPGLRLHPLHSNKDKKN